MDVKSPARQVALGALLTALAMIFSYVEALIPVSVAVPGIKLGIANIVIVYALYAVGEKYAFAVNICRIFLSALLFGTVFSLIYSAAGGILSFAAMYLLKKTDRFSIAGVSMAGGVFHNLGQLVSAALMVETAKIFYYFPVLLFAGMATGIINGMAVTLCLRNMRAYGKK